jgi:heptosyltransferase-3
MSAPPSLASAPIALPAKARILVVTLRRIGDVLLTTPLIRSLRRAWPDATIDVLVFDGTADIVKGNPDINDVIGMPARPTIIQTCTLVWRLWKQYDLAVSTQTGDRPTMFALAAGRIHAGLTATDGPRSARRSSATRFIAARRPCRTSIASSRCCALPMRSASRVYRAGCPAADPFEPVAPGERYAVIHAAPMFRYKQWTREGWRALAAGPRAARPIDCRDQRTRPARRKYLDEVWQGAITIHQFAWPKNVALLSHAQVYIGPDTSVSHLAAATGCPTVTLFGPTDPRIWGPWPVGGLDEPWQASGSIQRRGNVRLVQIRCRACRACSKAASGIESASACLQELPADQVLTAVDQALASGRQPRAGAA